MPFDPNDPNPQGNDHTDPASLPTKPIASADTPLEQTESSFGFAPPSTTDLEPNDTGLMYLHPTSLFFDILAHGRTYLLPIILGLFGAAQGEVTFLIISAIAFVPAVGMSIFRFVTLKYQIKDNQLVVNKGFFFKQTRTVPVSRIQNIDLIQNVLHRVLGVAEVRIETASGTEPEAVLRVLSLVQLEKLRGAIFSGQKKDKKSTASPIPGESTFHDQYAGLAVSNLEDSSVSESDKLLEIPLSHLIQAGLASNRGLLMVGVLLGFYFQFGQERSAEIIQFLSQWFPKFESSLWLGVVSVLGMLGVLVLLRLLGVGWYLLRFFGYRLELRGDDLRISCGMFTKVSATVPRKRIQFISIHRHWMMRLMGLASIRIETAGGAGEKQKASESVSKRWFIPVLPEYRIPELIAHLRPGLQWNETGLHYQRLAPKAGTRLARIAIVVSVLLMGVGLYFWRPFGFIPGLALLPAFLWWSYRQAKSMRYARTEQGVVYRSGVLNRKVSMTFFEKIQALEVVQNPFDHRWGMAKLTIDTAAAGPAEHEISIPYLDAEFAREEFQILRSKTGANQPVFG